LIKNFDCICVHYNIATERGDSRLFLELYIEYACCHADNSATHTDANRIKDAVEYKAGTRNSSHYRTYVCCRFEWYFNGRQMETSSASNSERFVKDSSTDGTLHLKTRPSDVGYYQCRAINHIGVAMSNISRLVEAGKIKDLM